LKLVAAKWPADGSGMVLLPAADAATGKDSKNSPEIKDGRPRMCQQK